MTDGQFVLKKVEEHQLPQILYKYMGLGNDLLNNRTLKVVNDCSLRFSSCKDFNDPFDCRIYPGKISEEWLKCMIKGRHPNCNEKLIERKIKSADCVKIAKLAISDHMEGEGICCMTSKPKNILMWSHYANSHKGVCLGFDVCKDPDFFFCPIDVQYAEDYPKVPDAITDDYFKILIGTKYAGWSYEQEVRIWKSPAGEYEFNPEALKEIIFGCQIGEAIKRIIISEVRRNQALNHVQFFQAETSATDYKLDITPLDC